MVPDAVQASALVATLSAVNDAVNWVSDVGLEHHGFSTSVRDLRKLCYGELKARGLGAQAAQHVIKRVVDACSTLRANIRNGTWVARGRSAGSGASADPVSFDAATSTTTAVCRRSHGPCRSGPCTAG